MGAELSGAARIDDNLSDLTFLRPDGAEVRLADVPARALLVVFLRHLA